MGVAVAVFEGLAFSRQTKGFAVVLTASFQKPGELTAFPPPPSKSTSHHSINETTERKKGKNKEREGLAEAGCFFIDF